ncbi:MAG: InlB B-repeat-containing protein, partial [Candidatus Gracilibacteria bacterium]|nr:InlB B-repeat-containing protein [Candidatus Gracilibacteria bacterium]
MFTSSTSFCNFTRDLEFGMVGDDVRELQKYLNNNGFPLAQTGVGSPGKETTIFGILTKEALIKFQNAKLQTIPAATKLKEEFGSFFVDTRSLINSSQKSGVENASSYSLIYIAGSGGAIVGATNQIVKSGENGLSVTAIPNSGYYFTKWSDGLSLNPRTDINVMANKSITANFSRYRGGFVNSVSISRYTLSYTAGAGGTISGTTLQTVSNGSSGSAVTAVPSAGYAFVGWSDGVVTAERTDSFVTEHKTISAIFAINTYTVTFDINEGDDGSTAAQTLTYNTPTALTANGFTRTGYTFAGWATTAEGEVTYADEASYTIGTGNVTLYAKWTINTYTVTFDGNGSTGGTEPNDQTKTHDITLVLATNSGTLIKTGYTFDGWNTAANGSGTDYAEGENYTANVGVTLYAKWTIN